MELKEETNFHQKLIVCDRRAVGVAGNFTGAATVNLSTSGADAGVSGSGSGMSGLGVSASRSGPDDSRV